MPSSSGVDRLATGPQPPLQEVAQPAPAAELPVPEVARVVPTEFTEEAVLNVLQSNNNDDEKNDKTRFDGIKDKDTKID